jgi:hypothetical protein
VISDELEESSYALIPKLQRKLLENKIEEKPPNEVLRNYEYEVVNVYSNLCDWNTLTSLSPNCNYNLTKINLFSNFINQFNF